MKTERSFDRSFFCLKVLGVVGYDADFKNQTRKMKKKKLPRRLMILAGILAALLCVAFAFSSDARHDKISIQQTERERGFEGEH